MADKPSIRIVKDFTYRGETRTFSNRYHFDGAEVGTHAEFVDLADAVIELEKHLYSPGLTIVKADFKLTDDGLTLYSKAYDVEGSTTTFTGDAPPGDCAGLIRYTTDARTSNNHPIYLFNYYHGCKIQSGSDADAVDSVQVAKYGTYAAAWRDGIVFGSQTAVRCGPRGAVALDWYVNPWVTHRDLPHH